MAHKARKRKITLGASRATHAKYSRGDYKYAMDGFDKALADVRKGACAKALEKFTVANQDMGAFLTNFTHAVGAQARGVMAAPRMKRALTTKRQSALDSIVKKCLITAEGK